MAKIREILRRRKTARNIRKITRTMEMIATSRYRRVHGQVAGLHPYAEALTAMVGHVCRRVRVSTQPLLQSHPQVKRDALVVIAANRGMCGGYNTSLVRLAVRRIREQRAAGRELDIYAFGTRTLAGLRQAGIEPFWQHLQFEGRVVFDEVARLSQTLMERFIAGELGAVELIYTRFETSTRQSPVVEPLLPLAGVEPAGRKKAEPPAGKTETAEKSKAYQAQYLFMPKDPHRVLRALLPRAVVVRAYRSFLDALASEYLARMTAMRTATENAEDMAHQLTQQYNRARQGGITRELAEIVGGAEALK
jgi:F-type H+-transporting ATPase subunit gamma